MAYKKNGSKHSDFPVFYAPQFKVLYPVVQVHAVLLDWKLDLRLAGMLSWASFAAATLVNAIVYRQQVQISQIVNKVSLHRKCDQTTDEGHDLEFASWVAYNFVMLQIFVLAHLPLDG